jgi:hypothetical protein
MKKSQNRNDDGTFANDPTPQIIAGKKAPTAVDKTPVPSTSHVASAAEVSNARLERLTHAYQAAKAKNTEPVLTEDEIRDIAEEGRNDYAMSTDTGWNDTEVDSAGYWAVAEAVEAKTGGRARLTTEDLHSIAQEAQNDYLRGLGGGDYDAEELKGFQAVAIARSVQSLTTSSSSSNA